MKTVKITRVDDNGNILGETTATKGCEELLTLEQLKELHPDGYDSTDRHAYQLDGEDEYGYSFTVEHGDVVALYEDPDPTYFEAWSVFLVDGKYAWVTESEGPFLTVEWDVELDDIISEVTPWIDAEERAQDETDDDDQDYTAYNRMIDFLDDINAQKTSKTSEDIAGLAK